MTAFKTDGTFWGWGVNQYGQLGLNDRSHRSSPTQIPGTWAGTRIQGTTQSIRFQKSDGTLWATGYNQWGQFMLNDIVHRSSPTQIPGDWVAGSLAYGESHNLTSALQKSNT